MNEWTEKDIKEIREWNEKDHPRAGDGKFTNKSASELKAELQREVSDELPPIKSAEKKMTPEEKIASVHIDFSKDNILPELNESELEKMGLTESKPVLLKSYTIKRNLGKHFDVTNKTMQDIIAEALYNPIDVFPANPNNPNYYHLASFVEIEDKRGLKMGLVLLDTDISKANFEIGHAYYVDSSGFDKAMKKAIKKD